MQIVDGEARVVAIKEGKGSSGIFARDAKIIRALLPIRDTGRGAARAGRRPALDASPIRLRIAYSTFVRGFGPINHTVVSVTAGIRRLVRNGRRIAGRTSRPSPSMRLLAASQHRRL